MKVLIKITVQFSELENTIKKISEIQDAYPGIEIEVESQVIY